jgi:hypothetical protein
MKQRAILILTVVAAAVSACSDDSGDGGTPMGSMGGSGGGAGLGGAAGTGGAGTAGAGGSSGATSPPVPPTPALPPGSATVSCGNTISGSLDASDPAQTGRHSRIAPASACGATKAFPGNAADPLNPHLYDVYRFANPGTASACFTFALNYGAAVVVADAGLDAGEADASAAGGQDAGLDAGADAAPAPPPPARYLTAYSTFYPTDLTNSYLGDVGDSLTSPQTMGITVPAGGTIDVVVYAIEVAPAGAGAYTLRCSVQ